jgi:hypothetical protein
VLEGKGVNATIKSGWENHPDGIGQVYRVKIVSEDGMHIAESELPFPMFSKSDFKTTQGSDKIAEMEMTVKDIAITAARKKYPGIKIN